MNSAKKILIVGCGNIGSRHLQAVAKLSNVAVIDIIEPNSHSQTVAKSRFEEIPIDKNLRINWYKSLDSFEEESDLVIIATSSKGRVKIIETLLALGHKRFLIEKMVCQSQEEYEHLINIMARYKAIGWVNTPRRYYQSYRNLRTIFNAKNSIYLSVTAGNEGLGSNAIHFIDLFSWFSGEYNIHLKGDFLNNQIFTTKRGAEYKEFAGTIIGSTDNNKSLLTISFLPFDTIPLVVTIIGNDNHFIIDETNNNFYSIKSRKELKINNITEYTSNLTTKIVTDIFEKKFCSLPTVQESSFAHYQLFNIFNEHLKKVTKNEIRICPIS